METGGEQSPVELTSHTEIQNLKKLCDDTEPKYPESGSCISFSSSKPKVWYNVLEECYYHNVSDQETDRVCNWKDSNVDAAGKKPGAKMTYRDKHLSVTISIFTTTGTICVQGSNRSLRVCHVEHYPALAKVFSRLLETVNKAEQCPPKTTPSRKPNGFTAMIMGSDDISVRDMITTSPQSVAPADAATSNGKTSTEHTTVNKVAHDTLPVPAVKSCTPSTIVRTPRLKSDPSPH